MLLYLAVCLYTERIPEVLASDCLSLLTMVTFIGWELHSGHQHASQITEYECHLSLSEAPAKQQATGHDRRASWHQYIHWHNMIGLYRILKYGVGAWLIPNLPFSRHIIWILIRSQCSFKPHLDFTQLVACYWRSNSCPWCRVILDSSVRIVSYGGVPKELLSDFLVNKARCIHPESCISIRK